MQLQVTEDGTYRDRKLGFELDLPAGATVLDESELGLVLELTGVEGADQPRVVVTVEPAEPGVGLARLVDRALANQEAGAGLIDRRADRLGGVAAEHTLIHREVQSIGVTVEEWRAIGDGRLFTVSAACASVAYDRHADGFAALVAGLRLTRAQRSVTDAVVRFDPATGMLVATETGFEALRSAARDQPPDPAAKADADALSECGALVAGRPHPALEHALAPTLAPALELNLSWGDAVARGWADARSASLLVPLATGQLRRLASLPASLLPGVLAGMVGLRPRPAPKGREPVELGPAELGRLIAEQRGQAPAIAAQAAPPSGATGAVAGLRAHWRINAHWVQRQQMEMLEVIDAEHGLWLVLPAESGARLEPTHAAAIWRHLTGLIPTSQHPFV